MPFFVFSSSLLVLCFACVRLSGETHILICFATGIAAASKCHDVCSGGDTDKAKAGIVRTRFVLSNLFIFSFLSPSLLLLLVARISFCLR